MYGWVDIPKGDHELLKCALVKVGPIAAAMDARQKTFLLYSNGKLVT